MKHDVKILFGDLNFRINLGYELAVEVANRFNSNDI